MKKLLNPTMRWAIVLLIAFAAPNVVNAQFGNLKKVVKGAVKSAVKEKVEETKSSVSTTTDNDPYGGNQVEQLKRRKQEASAQQDAEREDRQKAGCKIIECRRDNQIASWHSRENKIVSFLDDETYIFDAAGRVIRTESGKTVATLTENGLNIPSIDANVTLPSGGGVTINGESCGKVTRQDLYIYGRRLGNFFCEAPREMVAFFLLSNYASPETRAKMKRTQFMDGTFLNASGSRIGYIKGGALYNIDKYYPKLGTMHYSDDETVIGDNKFRVGALQYDGTVHDNSGNKIGQIKENGDIVNASGTLLARVGRDGKISDKTGKFLVQFSGERPVAAAAAYYFFFKERIR